MNNLAFSPLFAFPVLYAVYVYVGSGSAFVNNRPIIGVMTQESPSDVSQFGSTYLPATYVKFVEASGARVVPILVNQSDIYYENMFHSLNGLLLPGGGLDEKLMTSGYGRAGKMFYDLATKNFDKYGDVFPIWGTCQGFELLSCLAAGEDILTPLEADNENLNIEMCPGYRNSRIFGDAADWILEALQNDALTFNYHSFSVTPQDFNNAKSMKSTYKMVSISKNDDGREFVSVIEGNVYPLFGVQFHPEKPIFAWSPNTKVKHDALSVAVSRYFGDFFVSEARKSNHSFKSLEEETAASIYNYNTVNLKGLDKLDDAYFFN
ncbi:gamma-glutamyl hydrolase-like [Apostichopus japonicus]|uniref:gamma-glutamyl hydrolase-like n=1 Tax=Stichopus japonicus TaxID=307972 RepID=UPI003AB89113